MKTINFEEITLRMEISSRGGGIEIALDDLGWPDVKMTAYQNYLGGGMLGRVCNACTISDWQDTQELVEIAEQLAEYFHNLTNPDPDMQPWESSSFEDNQKRPGSAY